LQPEGFQVTLRTFLIVLNVKSMPNEILFMVAV
jgi:hypothetical protein